jgi:hypothetical protein
VIDHFSAQSVFLINRLAFKRFNNYFFSDKTWLRTYDMIYRTFFSLLIAALIFAVGQRPLPAHGNAADGNSDTISSSTNAFEGLLVVREADGVFLIRSENGEKRRFRVSQQTTITRNGKPADYGDLRSRDLIRVHYNADFVVIAIQATGS